MSNPQRLAFLLVALFPLCHSTAAPPDPEAVERAMRRAAEYYVDNASLRGGYVYYYSPDLQTRYGEGLASDSQIWVQPPGTPTVGMALLAAYEATSDPFYLESAQRAGDVLLAGQLESGGWQNHVDFEPSGSRSHRYRGMRKGRNNSTLDDGITQSALTFLIQLDAALDFKDARLREATQYALDRLLQAQFPNGAFPQVWQAPVQPQPIKQARLPEYDWRTENRIKEYWNLYTLNDNVASNVAAVLIEAERVYGDQRYRDALIQLGDFLLLAQLPEPQPAWAQQYHYEMYPSWARPFEPPAIASSESQDVIDTLLTIYKVTAIKRFLEPIPAALDYLQRSQLADENLARYYELGTNRPLYMYRRGDVYRLTYRDDDLPSHYGWKIEPRITELRDRYQRLANGDADPTAAIEASEVSRIMASLDEHGRWLSRYDGARLTGQPKFRPGQQYLSSAVFANNLSTLAQYLKQISAE